MNRLASAIRNRLDTLAVEYDRRLQEIDGYSQVPEQERLDTARHDLALIATCLEAGDDAEFVQSIHSRTRARMAQGFSAAALMQAIVALEETLLPLVSNVKAAKFLWCALSKVRGGFPYQADGLKSSSEVKLTAVAQGVADLMDAMDIALWELDANYRVVGLNRRAKDIYGQDIIGEFCYHCAAGLDQVCPNCPTEKVYQGAPSARSEHQRVDTQGNRIYIDHIATPLTDKDGHLTGALVLIIDITERKQAEEALRGSERRFRQLFEEASDVVYTTDAEGLFTYINPPGLRLTGYAEDELIGRHFTTLVHPEWRERVQTFYLKQFRDRTRETTLEFPAVSRAGEMRWIEQTVILLSDGDWVIGFQSIVHDVTGRKQAEEAAQRRLENLSAVVEVAAELSEEHTIDGLCRRAVELGREKLGIDRISIWLIEDEDHPTRLRGTFGTNEEGQTQDERSAVMEPGEDSDMGRVLLGQLRASAREEPLYDGQGRVRRFGWHTTVPLEGHGGRALGVLCADSLLTQQVWDAYMVEILKLYGLSVGSLLDGVRLQESLQDSEAKYSAVVQQAKDGVLLLQGDLCILANPAMEDILGYTPEEMENTPFSQYIAPEGRELVASQIRARLAGHEVPTVYEAKLQHKNGAVRDVELSGGVIQYQGRPADMEIIRDITERKRLQRAIQESLERRAQQVRTSTEVAQEIAAAPALDELFHQVVKLIRVRFDYYHTQIFRYEPTLESLVLVAGYGEPGEKMLAEGYRLATGHGVVGLAAATGRPVLASDVTQDVGWAPHPHLPKTKGELAVPIKLRDEVLGILDVQSDQAGALTEDDQLLLEGLCGQIAIAIQSTHLRQEMEENLRELNAMYRTVSREGWQALRKTTELPEGYFFNRADVQPADDLWTPEIELAMKQEKFVTPAPQREPAGARERRSRRKTGGQTAAVAPLSVHGEIIGALGVYDDSEVPLSSEELALMESVSEQVALALESARLFEQTQAALSQTEMLYRVSRAIGEAASTEDIVQGATIVARSLGFSACTLTLITSTDEEGQPLCGDVYALLSSGGDWVVVPPITDLPLGDQSTTSAFMDDPSFVLVIEDMEDPEADIPDAAREMVRSMGMRAAVTAGLSPHGRPVGFLSLVSAEPLQGLSEDRIRQVRTVADQMAVALESRRLFEQTQAALAETRALYEASAALNAVQSYDDVLNALRAHTLLGQANRSVGLSMFDRPWVGEDMPDSMITIARWGSLSEESYTPRYAVQDFPLTSGLLHSDAPTVIADVGTDPRLDGKARKWLFERYGARSVIAVPLVVGGQWIGFVDGLYGEATEFPETQVHRLMALTAQAAVAIQSLNQLSEIQDRAHSEQVLRQIMAAVNASEDLAADLPGLTRHVRDLIPVDLLTLALYTPGDRDFSLFFVGVKAEDSYFGRQGVRLPLEGTGSGWAITHDDSWLDMDLHERKTFIEDEPLVAEEVAARLILPLKAGRQVIGALTLGSVLPGTYSGRHVPVLRQIADQMALALERARLLQETRAALEQVQATHQRYLRESWQDYLAARERTLQPAYLYDQTRVSVQPELSLPEMDEALARRELVVSDGSGEGKHTIAAPISLRGQPIGVLAVEAPPDGRSWSDEEIALVEAVSAQLALAMENTRLFEETQVSAQRERTLREVTERVRAAGDMESLLRSAAQEIRRALGASRATIRLGLEDDASTTAVAGKQQEKGESL